MAGRPPKEKCFATALNVAIREAQEDGKDKLRGVADKLVELALNGDMQAIKEVADRLDGKPMQSSEVTVKREQTDFDRETLMAIANASDGSEGAVKANGRGNGPDSVH